LTAPREGSPLGTARAPEGEAPQPDKKPNGQAPEGETEAGAETPLPTAAELAEAVKLPEGMEVDTGLMEKFSTLAAKEGLNTEQAQSLADLYTEAQKSYAESVATAQQKAWDQVIDKWKADISSDPDIGGDKSDGVQTSIGRALDEYGSDEARVAFEVTAAGWNPAIIKFIWKMAAALEEGSPVPGFNPARQGPKSIGQILYDGKYQEPTQPS
jgi:hypothetical protein